MCDDEGPEQPGFYFRFLDKRHADSYRSAEVANLTQAVEARENRLIVGLPGMGVSNLLRFLVARGGPRQHEVTYAYVDCRTLSDPLDAEALFEQVATQLAEQGLGEAAEGVGYQLLLRLVKRVGGSEFRRIVLVVDQADGLLAVVNQRFYERLKALTDQNKRVCVLLAAGPGLADSVDPDGLLFSGRRLYVGPLGASDLADAIGEEERRLRICFDEPTRALLGRLTGGHPGLLRAVSSAFAEDARAPLGLEACIARLLERGDIVYRCRKLWQALGPAEQQALTLLVAGRRNGLPGKQLVGLAKLGLLEDHAAGGLVSPLFRAFITAQATGAGPPQVALALGEAPPGPAPGDGAVEVPTDAEAGLERVEVEIFATRPCAEQEIAVAGRVRKGGKEIRVPPLVFRLIACLARRPIIYSHDAILAYVYCQRVNGGEVYADTRVQDLVRRARLCLGDERYIITHWGQGYEFKG